MTDEQNKKLEELMRKALQEQYNRGLRVGVLAASQVVMEKLNDTSKTLVERIDEIRKYCSVAVNNRERFLQADGTKKVEDEKQ